MLTRVYATNYRCLVNFEMKPSAKQLIIGRNGTGKTIVFELLAALRDFAVRGQPCEAFFGGRTLTHWQDVDEQRFELDVSGNGGEYRYTLALAEPRPKRAIIPPIADYEPRPRVKRETLSFNGKLIFRFEDGTVGLFRDPTAPLEFPHDWHHSGLATVEEEPHRREKSNLTWFKLWLDRLIQVQINPWAMLARSERESRFPAKDLSNFADWYRHLRLDSGNAVFEAIRSLREAISGLEALDAKEAGLDVRVLYASLRTPGGKTIEVPFSELSEGQRVLIALYVLLYCGVGEDRTLLIDEPDNFIALAEIQPWLLKLLDHVDEKNGQVILISHHPEVLDQLANQGGLLLDRPDDGETRILPFKPAQDSGLNASEIVARGWELAPDHE